MLIGMKVLQMIIKKLKSLNVISYQLSLDGLERKHDVIRKKGSFRATINALKLLQKNELKSVIMFTLSRYNIDDLLPIIDYLSELNVNTFSFARYVGNVNELERKISMNSISPIEYRNLLCEVQKKSKEISQKGSITKINKKDHLWKLLLYEQGIWKPQNNKEKQIISGCHIGKSNITILPNGIVYACRRFKSPIGNIKSKSVLDIFTLTELDYYRNYSEFEKCGACPLLYYCRGCPAVAFASSNYFYSKDPQCWR